MLGAKEIDSSMGDQVLMQPSIIHRSTKSNKSASPAPCEDIHFKSLGCSVDEVMPVMMVQSSTLEEQIAALTKTLEKFVKHDQRQTTQLKELSDKVDQVRMSRCSSKHSSSSFPTETPHEVLKTSPEIAQEKIFKTSQEANPEEIFLVSREEVSATEMCTKGMCWSLQYILQGLKPKNFEELATRAHDMELTVAISKKEDDGDPEWQDEWRQQNSSSSELQARGEPSSEESNSFVGSPKSEYNYDEDEDEATSYLIMTVFEPSNFIAPPTQQVNLQSTSNSNILLDKSLNYPPSSKTGRFNNPLRRMSLNCKLLHDA
ncbi:hypothetical protein Vadar_000344 [Vaccinium darrowii]|uniref:Uncharacterized protein n=1 Tax=Vaccinium darrowii TaxID=229202 RepID=A0ACB7XN99_9ERIC|nr:hypothetical protein Vadar_000344 [Vaccinium darrowii]